MDNQVDKVDNERKTIINNLLIQSNISIFFSLLFYTILFFIIYLSIDYFNILNNSIFGPIKINYLLINLKSSLKQINNYYHSTNKEDLIINVIGINENDHKILENLIFSNKDYSESIILNNLYSNHNYPNISIKTNLKRSNRKISELKEISLENFENLLDSLEIHDQLTYSLYVSFEQCYNSQNKNIINIYNKKYSLFCISKDNNSNDFFIMMSDIIDIWFRQFIEKKIQLIKYNSIYIYINNIIDYRVKDIKQIRNDVLIYSLFHQFLNQTNEILNLKLINQNKYIDGNDVMINDPGRIYHILNQNINNEYCTTDSNTFNLNLVNYISYTNHTFFDANQNLGLQSMNNDTDIYFHTNNFLFTCMNLNDLNSYNKVISTWIYFIRNLLLPENYCLEHKSRLNNVVIKNHIEKEYINILLTDWQISAFKLINNKYILTQSLNNIHRFIEILKLYNIYKLPKYIYYSINYINKLITNFKQIEFGYTSVLLQDSHDLLFNEDIHNSKSFDNDLVMAIYSPTAIPLLFIIVITLFRVIRYSRKKFL